MPASAIQHARWAFFPACLRAKTGEANLLKMPPAKRCNRATSYPRRPWIALKRARALCARAAFALHPAAIACAARRPRSHNWDCSALCIYPLEQLYNWDALVRVEPHSQVPGKRACCSTHDGRTYTSTGRPADDVQDSPTRAAPSHARRDAPTFRARSRPSRAARLVGISAHKTVSSRGLAPAGKRRSRRLACIAFAS